MSYGGIACQANIGLAAAILFDVHLAELAAGNGESERATIVDRNAGGGVNVVLYAERAPVLNAGHGEGEVWPVCKRRAVNLDRDGLDPRARSGRLGQCDNGGALAGARDSERIDVDIDRIDLGTHDRYADRVSVEVGQTGGRDGNRVGAVFVDIEVVAVTVSGDREDAADYSTDEHLAGGEKRTALQGFQGGHPAASLGLPGPVVVVGEPLKTGALRKEA